MALTRRQTLKSLSVSFGGATLSPALSPFIQQARAEAAGDAAALPKRVVFVVKSSGLTPCELVPEQFADDMVERTPGSKPSDNYVLPGKLRPAERLIDRSLKDATLPPTLKALEPFKDRTVILQGLSGKMCKGGHSSWYGALGCIRTGGEHNTGRPVSATIDGLLATAMPGIFPHVGLSIGGKVMESGVAVKDSVVYPGISAMAKDRPIPYQASPTLAYNDLFGVAATGKDAQSQQQLKGTLLDFMVDDIKRVVQRIGGAEKDKLDRYLSAFDVLRDRRRKLKGVEARIRQNAPTVTDKFTSKVETDRLEAHFDIAAASLIAGLTNVISIRPDTLSMMYAGLGIDRNVHGIGHGGGTATLTPLEARNRIREFHINQIARLAATLKAVPEGDGTMLDNTLIVYLSDAAEKHHASCIEWPFILVGGLGGKLKTTGRYLQYPAYGKPGHHTIANLYITLMHAIGKPLDTFGQLDLNLDESRQKGPLSALLA